MYRAITELTRRLNTEIEEAAEFLEVESNEIWREVMLSLIESQPGQRRALLTHLLEAEAAERVEVVLCRGTGEFRYSLGGAVVSLYKTEVSVLRDKPAENLILCLAAALAEQRKKESAPVSVR